MGSGDALFPYLTFHNSHIRGYTRKSIEKGKKCTQSDTVRQSPDVATPHAFCLALQLLWGLVWGHVFLALVPSPGATGAPECDFRGAASRVQPRAPRQEPLQGDTLLHCAAPCLCLSELLCSPHQLPRRRQAPAWSPSHCPAHSTRSVGVCQADRSSFKDDVCLSRPEIEL